MHYRSNLAFLFNSDLWNYFIPRSPAVKTISCYLILLGLGILGAFKFHKLIPLALFLFVLTFNIVHFNIYYNNNGLPDPSVIPYVNAAYFEDYLNMEHMILFFLSGACFYYYRQYIQRSIYVVIVSAILLIVSARWVRVFELAQAVFGAYLLFYFIFSKRIRLYNFAKYGDFSYGIYLFGWPIQQLVMLYPGSKISFAASLFILLPIIFCMAFVSWHLVERRALLLKKRSIYPGLHNRLKLVWARANDAN